MHKHILVIDDDDSIAEVVKLILENEGYAVDTLPNGADLDMYLDESLPNMFILDYLLPGKNGAEITTALRQNFKTSGIPILVMAAQSANKSEAKLAGADDFLAKPFDIDQLVTMVKRYIPN